MTSVTDRTDRILPDVYVYLHKSYSNDQQRWFDIQQAVMLIKDDTAYELFEIASSIIMRVIKGADYPFIIQVTEYLKSEFENYLSRHSMLEIDNIRIAIINNIFYLIRQFVNTVQENVFSNTFQQNHIFVGNNIFRK